LNTEPEQYTEYTTT